MGSFKLGNSGRAKDKTKTEAYVSGSDQVLLNRFSTKEVLLSLIFARICGTSRPRFTTPLRRISKVENFDHQLEQTWNGVFQEES